MMKIKFNYILLVVFCLSMMSCALPKKGKFIAYMFPNAVDVLLEDKVNNIELPVYFTLKKKNDGNFIVYVQKVESSGKRKKWIKETNRYVFINKNFYPLLIDYDGSFGTLTKPKELVRQSKEDLTYLRIAVIRHEVYYVEFTIRGKILYEGY